MKGATEMSWRRRLYWWYYRIDYGDIVMTLLGFGLIAAMVLALIRLARWALG